MMTNYKAALEERINTADQYDLAMWLEIDPGVTDDEISIGVDFSAIGGSKGHTSRDPYTPDDPPEDPDIEIDLVVNLANGKDITTQVKNSPKHAEQIYVEALKQLHEPAEPDFDYNEDTTELSKIKKLSGL